VTDQDDTKNNQQDKQSGHRPIAVQPLRNNAVGKREEDYDSGLTRRAKSEED